MRSPLLLRSALQRRFSKLTWMPCTAHVLDLFLEDIGKQEWAKDPFRWAQQIVKFIRGRGKPLAIFRAKSKLELKSSCAPTSWSFVVLHSAGECAAPAPCLS